MVGQTEMRKFIRDVKDRDGWSVERTRGNHMCLTYRDGSQVFASSTPSDYRSIKNAEAAVKRVERRAQERKRKVTKTEETDDFEIDYSCSQCSESGFADAFELSAHVRQDHSYSAKRGRKDTDIMSNKDKVREFVMAHSPTTTDETVEGTGLTNSQVHTAWHQLKDEAEFDSPQPGIYVYDEDGEELEELGNGRRGRSRVILNFMHKHPGRAFTVEELAEELFPKEFAEDSSGTSGRCSTAAARMARADGYRIERVGRGVYRYVPAGVEDAPDPKGQADPEGSGEVEGQEQEQNERAHAAAEKVVSSIQFAPAKGDATLFEAVRELRDGKLLLESEGGRLYVARQLDLEV